MTGAPHEPGHWEGTRCGDPLEELSGDIVEAGVRSVSLKGMEGAYEPVYRSSHGHCPVTALAASR